MTRLAALLSELSAAPWAIREESLDALRVALARPFAQGGEVGGDGRHYIVGEHGPETLIPAAAVHPATEKATARKAGSVAIIPVRGTISNSVSVMDWIFGNGSTSPASVVQRTRAALADDAIKAVVYEYDSPGGSVFGVAEAADQLFAMRGKKPMIAQVVGQCCSAAYHMASAADDIVAAPSSMIGSIGVYMIHSDWSKWNAETGIQFTYIHAGKFKVEGNPDAPLDEKAAAHLQEMCDDYMRLFVDAVAKGRGVAASEVRGERFGQGRTYIASRALERGLVDKVRTFDDTLAAYGVSATIEQAKPRRSLALARREHDLRA